MLYKHHYDEKGNRNVLSFYFFKIRYNSEKLTELNTMTYYLGIMSGTSLDGVDIALTDIQSNQTKLIAADFTPMPANLREKVTALIQSGETSLQALGSSIINLVYFMPIA